MEILVACKCSVNFTFMFGQQHRTQIACGLVFMPILTGQNHVLKPSRPRGNHTILSKTMNNSFLNFRKKFNKAQRTNSFYFFWKGFSNNSKNWIFSS